MRDEGYLELSKSEFVRLLKDTDILIKPKPQKVDDKNKDKGGEKKDGDDSKPAAPIRKFEESEAEDAIGPIVCFEHD